MQEITPNNNHGHDLENEEKNKYMYYKLVKNSNDFLGMIAYGIYKQSKIEFIVDFKNASGVKPSSEQLQTFQLSHCTDEKAREYRAQANNLATTFINILASQKKNELMEKEKQIERLTKQLDLKESELKNRDKELGKREKEINNREKFCKAVKPGNFWYGILQNLFASFIFVFITVLIFLYTTIPNDIGNHIISNFRTNVESTINTMEQ